MAVSNHSASGIPPRLTIGLPVYNGERYLRFAIDSLLQQTFEDFELIISDNASTDSTKIICQEYAARDSRIRYYRNQSNIGAAKNFNQVFQMARGNLFKWAAADDVLSPNFLERCIDVLDCEPSVVLSYSKVDRINSAGELEGTYDYEMRVSHPRPSTRFTDLILINHFCIAVFGVIRREYLEKTPLIGPYVGSDRVLLAELGLRGKLHEVPEYLFHRRDHPQASGRMYQVYNRLAWFDPTRKHSINLVYWKIGTEYLRSVLRVPLPRTERMASLKSVMKWFITRRRALIEDLKAVVVYKLPFSKNLLQFARRLHRHRA
jgi:glycosyltransferase involved in cell wall biosynthesis